MMTPAQNEQEHHEIHTALWGDPATGELGLDNP